MLDFAWHCFPTKRNISMCGCAGFILLPGKKKHYGTPRNNNCEAVNTR
jgi:hypothetical protein